MAQYNEIILYGFDEIKIKQDDEDWKDLLGAVSINVNISSGEVLVAKNPTFSQSFGGSIEADGQLTLLELSLENRAKLFGHSISENNGMRELIVKQTDTTPNFGLRFSKTKANGKKIIYQFDSVKFSEPSINANTMVNNELTEDNITIDFTINNKNGVLYRVFENV